MKSVLLIALSSLFILTTQVEYDLSESDISSLKKNELVVREQPIDTLPWPETTTYALANVSPLEALAVFTDFDAQENYIPRVQSSKGIVQKQPWIVNLKIKAEVPWPVNESSYTTGNVIEQYGPEKYRVEWYMVEAEHFNNTVGYAAFEPFQGKTLIIYNSLVEPQTPFLAQFFKGRVISENKQVVGAIRDRMNTVKNDESQYLQQRVEKMQNILSAKGQY